MLARVDAGDEGAATGVLLTATQIANALGIAILTGASTASANGSPRTGFAVGMGVAIALVALTAAAAAGLRTRTASPRCENPQITSEPT